MWSVSSRTSRKRKAQIWLARFKFDRQNVCLTFQMFFFSGLFWDGYVAKVLMGLWSSGMAGEQSYDYLCCSVQRADLAVKILFSSCPYIKLTRLELIRISFSVYFLFQYADYDSPQMDKLLFTLLGSMIDRYVGRLAFPSQLEAHCAAPPPWSNKTTTL